MSSDNATKLRSIMQFFGITVSAVGKATGKSQTYVSRVLSQHDILAGSIGFWSCLEKELGRLIQEKRLNQVFSVLPVDVSKADELRKSA